MGENSTAAPRERPIIMSAESSRAILAGRKTQTRRPVKGATGAFWDHAGYTPSVDSEGVVRWAWSRLAGAPAGAPMPRCPYGAPGDRLWVREAWLMNGVIHYRADVSPEMMPGLKWRSPIHMPRAAARLLLEVVAVRVERLCDICEADAVAEGVGSVAEYRTWWESIHGPGSWDSRWVWVTTFRRVEPAGKAVAP